MFAIQKFSPLEDERSGSVHIQLNFVVVALDLRDEAAVCARGHVGAVVVVTPFALNTSNTVMERVSRAEIALGGEREEG